ncbi:MAG: amidohydrolase [Pseudomonadales bacterium]|nr:amidohydrolase [Halieaceae bacterium]MCP5165565.1 amidohydrolase [Pseudomonadales bacterium]MCP5190008.1 amidohydrolase [Pseudomonadales bacterium]MCP5205383.1 amidohydrolase [Pseudomonadales bacterium]
MTTGTGRIDVHHHIIPPAFAEEMARRGLEKVAGAPLPRWRPEDSIAVMDDNGIGTAITSLSAPGVYFGNKADAVKLARACNEFAAEMRARHPGRFGNFAVLPTPFAELATREAEYALDTLDADGVVLLGSTEGVFLGDPSYEELMAELDRREAVVFVHPNIHATSDELGLGAPGFLLEFLCDTTRAAVNLILTGTVEKYPRIRWILAHSGGFLPFVAWRISLANALPEYAAKAPQGILEYIRRFYYDTALSPSPYSLSSLRELVDPTHILFGSDYPFAPAPIVSTCCVTLDASPVWSDDVKHGIDREHALALLPRYAGAGEAVSAVPAPSGHDLRSMGRRLRGQLARGVLERIRNR